MRLVVALSVASLVAIGAAPSAIAGPPVGTPGASASSAGGRPDFAGSGQPDFAGSASSASAGRSNTSSNGSSRGNSSNTGSFPSNSNAGGNALSNASATAQPTLQVLDQAFSAGDISLIRDFFKTRAQENKPNATDEAVTTDGTVAATTKFRRGQKLTATYLIEPLSAELLAQLPSRPGLTYVRVGDDIFLVAGPDDVIVDIITDVVG